MLAGKMAKAENRIGISECQNVVGLLVAYSFCARIPMLNTCCMDLRPNESIRASFYRLPAWTLRMVTSALAVSWFGSFFQPHKNTIISPSRLFLKTSEVKLHRARTTSSCHHLPLLAVIGTWTYPCIVVHVHLGTLSGLLRKSSHQIYPGKFETKETVSQGIFNVKLCNLPIRRTRSTTSEPNWG